ncbi:MAG TPA: glycerophosphodiester phosphodiesterase family protein [bacterium]
MTPFETNKTLNFAHRGFTLQAPENSMAAFKAAMALGVDGIEFDVRTCKSGEVVVFHDPTLARLTDGGGFVKSKTLTELRALRIKSSNTELDERIPTLDELIETVKDRLLLNVEIKTKGLPKDHIEQKVVEILRHYGIAYQTIISSFNPIVLRRIRKIDDQIVTGYLLDKNFTFRNSEIPLSRLAGAKAIHFEKTLVTQKRLDKVRELGIYSAVWTVNDPNLMQQFVDMGVNVIISDRPDILKKIENRENNA